MSFLGPPRRSISRLMPLKCERQSLKAGVCSYRHKSANHPYQFRFSWMYLQTHKHEDGGNSHVRASCLVLANALVQRSQG